MSTVTGTFKTSVGHTSSTLTLGPVGDTVTINISGTYAQSVKLQKEVGSPGSGTWRDVPSPGPWTTANATVATNYTSTTQDERLRLLQYAYTSGTVTYTMSDSAATLFVQEDGRGNVTIKETETTRSHVKPVNFLQTVSAAEQTPDGAENTFLGMWVDRAKMLDPAQKHVVFDDFIGSWAIGDAGPADHWQSTVGSDTGGHAPVTATTVAAAPSGRVTIKSSDVETTGIAANGVGFNSIGLAYEPEEGELYWEVYMALDDVSEAYLFVGFTDVLAGSTLEAPIFASGAATLDSDATDAGGVLLDKDSTLAYFNAGGVNNGTDTTFPQAATQVTPVDDTFFRIGVRITTAGKVHAWVNGTKITPPAGITGPRATINLTPAIIVGTRSDNQVIATVDYVLLTQDRSSAAS